jgi:penicillin-binding protein 2
MYKSIVQSCDTYYYMLANDMGIDHRALHGPAGFRAAHRRRHRGRVGRRAAVAGVEEARFKRPEQQKWFAGETISIGIGQGYNATRRSSWRRRRPPGQQRRHVRPHLVKYITDSRSGEKTMIEPEPLRVLPWKRQNVEVIKRAMVGVNTGGHRRARLCRRRLRLGRQDRHGAGFSLKGPITRPPG